MLINIFVVNYEFVLSVKTLVHQLWDMILYALILRSRDILPLTSTTNYHCSNGESAIDLKLINKIVKSVLKKTDLPKNKCFLRTNDKTY